MRGDFEVDKGGYPIAAMPNPEVKGESYVMDVRTMNKLIDARNIPTSVATQVAAVLNGGLRAKVFESDWAKLNESSLKVYEDVINPTPQYTQDFSAGSSEGTDTTHQVTDNVVQSEAGSAQVEAVESDDSTAEESTPEVVLQNPASPEANAELAAIIAEANGADASDTPATPEQVAPSKGAGTVVPAPSVPALPVVVAPLQAPAK